MNFQAVVFLISYAVFSNTCSLEKDPFPGLLIKNNVWQTSWTGIELSAGRIKRGGEGVEDNGTRFFANHCSQFKPIN